jgi:hypothetical protein
MWHVTFPLQVKLAYELFFPSSYNKIKVRSFAFLDQYFIAINVTTKEYGGIKMIPEVYVKKD